MEKDVASSDATVLSNKNEEGDLNDYRLSAVKDSSAE